MRRHQGGVVPGHVIVAEVIRHDQEDVGLLGGGQPLLCGGGERGAGGGGGNRNWGDMG